MAQSDNFTWEELDRAMIDNYSDDLPQAMEAMSRLIDKGKKGLIPSSAHERLLYNSSLFQASGCLSVAILAFQTAVWDGSSEEQGISGSEEAIINMANLLSAEGCVVTVFANPPYASFPWSSPLCNPRYVCDRIFGETPEYRRYDIVVFWRRTDFSLIKEKRVTPRKQNQQKTIVCYWPHDVFSRHFSVQGLDGVFWLSRYQKEQYEAKIAELKSLPSVISGNGYNPQHFPELTKRENPYSCGYFSNYARGLETLLDLWPEVKKTFPRASLEIFYGREVWGSMSKEALERVVSKIERLKKHGVKERGKVGHCELAQAMSRISLWCYPCNTDTETYCITAIKAQRAGMIPVVITRGALKETVAPQAYQIAEADAESYKFLLFQALREVGEKERSQFVSFSQDKTWLQCLQAWLSLWRELKVDV